MCYKFGSFGLVSFDDIPDPPFELKDIGIESRKSEDYYFDNKERDIRGYLFQYTLKGCGILEADNETYHLEEGKAFFVEIPGDEKYYYSPATGKGEWQLLYIHFEGTAVRPYYNKIIQKTGKVLTLSINSSVIQYLLNLHEKLRNGMRLEQFYGSEIVFHLLCQLCSKVAFNQENYSPRTRKAIEQMERQFEKIDGISSLADESGISLSHFTREFTKETGINPMKFLTNIRLQNAMDLLRNTDLSVNEIALRSGFSCGNYFSKIFRKHTHLSPCEFRNQG